MVSARWSSARRKSTLGWAGFAGRQEAGSSSSAAARAGQASRAQRRVRFMSGLRLGGPGIVPPGRGRGNRPGAAPSPRELGQHRGAGVGKIQMGQCSGTGEEVAVMFNHTANAKGWWPLPAWLRALGSALAGVFLHQPSSPWLPVLLYGPLAPACVLWGVLGGAPPWALLVLPPAGFLVWTLMEYILHSGAFHNPARSTILRGIEASHLGHHDDPKDPNLMVARLAISLPLAVLMCALFLAVLRNVMPAGLMLP